MRSGFKSQAGYAARVQVSGEVRASRQPDDRLLSKSGVLWVRIPPRARDALGRGSERLMGNGVIGHDVWFWPRRVQVRALVPQLRRCAWCDCAFVRRMARFDSVHRLRAFRASARVFLVGTRCPGQHRGKAPCDRSDSPSSAISCLLHRAESRIWRTNPPGLRAPPRKRLGG